MKNTMRKLFSLALVVVMLACAIPFSAFAEIDLGTALNNLAAAKAELNSAQSTLDAHEIDLQVRKNAQANALSEWNTRKEYAEQKKSTYEYLKSIGAAEDTVNSAYGEWADANGIAEVKKQAYDDATAAVDRMEITVNNDRTAVKQAEIAVSDAQAVVDRLQNTTTTKKASLRLIVADESGNTITTINREYEPTAAFDLATLIPSGYTFLRMKSGVTSSIVELKAGQNDRTVIVRANSSTTTPPSTTAVPATVKVTVLKNDTARTQIGVYSVSIADINVTKTYDIKNLIPSNYTFISRKNGSTDTVVDLTAGVNQYTVIVAPKSNSISGGSDSSGGIWLGNNNDVVNKDPWPVYLNIYMNGNVSTIAKKVDITKGIAADGYVDLADVRTVVKTYFNAKDSDGIEIDGLYIFDGSFGGQYTTDVGRVDGYGNINEDRKLSTVNINVMIKNAVAKGTTASDPSNPKTGDMAFLTVTALVASAGALALVYANKKRFLVK